MSDEYENTLKIASKKHDITGIRVFDIREEKLPNLGMVPMLDAETGETQLVNTGSKAIRMQYEKEYKNKVDYFIETFIVKKTYIVLCIIYKNKKKIIRRQIS